MAEAEKNDQGASSASAGEVDTGFIKIIMIFFFIPGFLYIGVQVIRAMFKEDFLMTKRGKRKLAAIKAEKEKIHQAYVQAGSKESGGEDEAPQGEEAEDAPETPAEENEEGGDE